MLEENTHNTGHSILDVTPVATADRDRRRVKRSGRRMMPSEAPQENKIRTRAPKGGHFMMWVIAGAALLLAILIGSFVFVQNATVTIIPKVEAITVSPNVVFTAYQKAKTGELSYSIVSKTIQASEVIATTGEKEVNVKSSGTLRVYNNYSTTPLRLIKNTRFETPNGNIYRIRSSIIVPGEHKDGTKGSIDVTVYADIAGKSQNITGTNLKFTIPGLKGDARYNSFYATSLTPIVGGFVGTQPIVNQATLDTTQKTLRAQLSKKALTSIQSSLNKNQILFTGGLFTQFESVPVTFTSAGKATVSMKLRIYAPVFDKNKIAKSLSASVNATPNGGILTIDTPQNLTMSILNKATVDLNTDALIQFTLQGKTGLTWQINTTNLKKDLAGKPRNMLNTIMSGYPGIQDGKATIRPFWKKTFPKQINRIHIKLQSHT